MHVLAAVELGAGVELRHQPQLVQVAISEKEKHTSREIALQAAQRPHDSNRAANPVALVTRVTAVNKYPTRCQHHFSSALLIKDWFSLWKG
eukprot:514424-Prymnesium_polylepis.3